MARRRDVGALLLGGVKCLFFRVSVNWRSMMHRRLVLIDTSCSFSNHTHISASVSSATAATRCRRISWWSASFGLGPRPRPRRGLSCRPATADNLRDVRRAQPQHASSRRNAQAVVNHREHTVAQILAFCHVLLHPIALHIGANRVVFVQGCPWRCGYPTRCSSWRG